MSIVDPLTPPTVKLPPAIPTDFVWRLSIDHYHAMINAGILTDDDPVELLEGWLVLKMTKKPRHRMATGIIHAALIGIVPSGWYVDAQEPVTVDDSEPEPDVSVVRGDRRQYPERHPGPRDLGLLVEVSDATLERDCGIKKRLYARAAIPVYWIANLLENRIEVYTEPTGPTENPDYRQRKDYAPGDEIPVSLDGREVGRLAVSDLLP